MWLDLLLVWQRYCLFQGHFFSREQFGMCFFPSMPESHDDLLKHASHRDRQEPPEQSEEFCACEECKNGHNGMHSYGTAKNAWCKDLSHDDTKEQHQKNSHDQRHHPSLRESCQNTQCCYDIGPDHWQKVQQK